jgi:hypothetical protein
MSDTPAPAQPVEPKKKAALSLQEKAAKSEAIAAKAVARALAMKKLVQRAERKAEAQKRKAEKAEQLKAQKGLIDFLSESSLLAYPIEKWAANLTNIKAMLDD